MSRWENPIRAAWASAWSQSASASRAPGNTLNRQKPQSGARRGRGLLRCAPAASAHCWRHPLHHHGRPARAWYGLGAQPSARRLSARRRPFSVRMHAYDSISHSCFWDPTFGIVRGARSVVAMWRAARWMQHLHEELRLARQTGSGLRYRARRWFCSRGREEDRRLAACLRLMRPLDRPLRRRSSPNHRLTPLRQRWRRRDLHVEE